MHIHVSDPIVLSVTGFGVSPFRTSEYSTEAATFHSKPLRITQADMRVRLVPALDDNYMYLLIDEKSGKSAAVDPVEPQKVVIFVKKICMI